MNAAQSIRPGERNHTLILALYFFSSDEFRDAFVGDRHVEEAFDDWKLAVDARAQDVRVRILRRGGNARHARVPREAVASRNRTRSVRPPRSGTCSARPVLVLIMLTISRSYEPSPPPVPWMRLPGGRSTIMDVK